MTEITEQWGGFFWAVEATAVVAIAVMCLLIYTIRRNTLILQQFHEADEEKETAQIQRFNGEQAEQWFEKGDLQTLNNYCENYIKEAPNSVHANWYYALSHYNQGDYETAREYFENVIRINPLWREGAIIYLQEIANKIGLPSGHTIH